MVIASARQRVLTALSHEQPDRVPFSWNFGPTPEMTEVLQDYMKLESVNWYLFASLVDDVIQVSPRYTGTRLAANTDMWGIERGSQSYGNGVYDEIVNYPLANVKDISEIEAYPWPDPLVYDYPSFREKILRTDPDYSKAHKLAINVCGNPFEIYCWMTGLEQSMLNLILYPELVHVTLDIITGFFEVRLQHALKNTDDLVDILYFADDLGGQHNLLMSPQIYRDMVKPYHKRLFNLGHQLAPNAHIMFHSDGAVFDIIPELMDAGMDVLEAVQTDCVGMSPTLLKSTYGQEICFHGGISVQSLLPFSTQEEVAKECKHLVKIFGKGGGYIAAPSHAIQVGTPPENVVSMLQTVLDEETYASAIEIARKPADDVSHTN
jgi:uroporphyrinogen decarboxylase